MLDYFVTEIHPSPEIPASDIEGAAETIENLPKSSTRTAMMVDGVQVYASNGREMQILEWVVDNALVREFAPKPPGDTLVIT